MSDLYTSGAYLQTHPTWHTEDSPWKAKQILRGLVELDIHPKSVCEVGCGAGEILHQLCLEMPSDVHFTGFEISPQAFQMCKEREKERLTYRNEDFLLAAQPFYDVLLVIDVFEHIPDYMSFLKALRSRATYNVFHIPLELTVKFVLHRDALVLGRRSQGHLHYFNRSTALATLEDCGYTILKDFYTFWEGELPNRRPKHLRRRLAMRLLKAWNQDLAVRVLGGHALLVVAT